MTFLCRCAAHRTIESSCRPLAVDAFLGAHPACVVQVEAVFADQVAPVVDRYARAR